MAGIHSTVLVTVTEYTTVYPESLPTIVSSEIPTLTRSLGSSIQSSSLRVSSSIAGASELTHVILPSGISSSTLSTSHAIPSSSLPSSAILTGTTGIPPLPTAFDPPQPKNATDGEHFEWHSPNNTLLIIFSVALILIALLYIIALLYFVWRYARGHCESCSAKDNEIKKLIMRRSGSGGAIAPVMIWEDVEAQRPVQSRVGLPTPPHEPLQFPRPPPKAATNRTPKCFADRSTKSTVAEMDFIAAHRAETFHKLNSCPSPLSETLSYTDNHDRSGHYSVSPMSSPVKSRTLTPDAHGRRTFATIDSQDPIPGFKNPYAFNHTTRYSRED